MMASTDFFTASSTDFLMIFNTSFDIVEFAILPRPSLVFCPGLYNDFKRTLRLFLQPSPTPVTPPAMSSPEHSSSSPHASNEPPRCPHGDISHILCFRIFQAVCLYFSEFVPCFSPSSQPSAPA